MASTLVILACAVLSVISGSVAQTYSPDTQHVYHLFTRENPTVSQPMMYGWSSLIGSNFNKDRPTGVIMHGSNSGPTSQFIQTVIPAALAGIDANLLVVDWSMGAAEPDYNLLVNRNVPIGAEGIARFIVWLNSETGQTPAQFHLVGYEVASHMAGLVGRALDGEIGIISVMYPPRYGWNASNIFAPTDGVVTEAIHTDIFRTGMMDPVAHMDFYPNSGLPQPGCPAFNWECSRDRSYLLFAEAIRSGGFTAAKCETAEEVATGACDYTDTVPMGGITDRTGISGLFYLATNSVSPYSMG